MLDCARDRSLPNVPRAQRPNAGRPALLLAGLVTVLLTVGVASARADSPIEAIWSFNGGKVGIQEQPNGTFVGTVVAVTKFDQCDHPVGQEMWTDMRPQPDGSFWGLHDWYFATPASPCTLQPNAGPSAWRVLKTRNEARFLRACFSSPASNLQPKIAPDGTSTGVTYGCFDSALIAPLPAVSSSQFAQFVTLPTNKTCFGRSVMRIQMRDPKNDPLKKVVVKLKSGKIRRTAKVRRHGANVTATLNLRGLSAGSFTVTVRLTTVLGSHLSRKRTYQMCATNKHPHSFHLHR
jgi:hypothetical protein